MAPGTKTDLQKLIEQWVRQNVSDHDQPPILMMSGAQGIGKSTALRGIESLDEIRIVVIGLDEVYHTRQTRLDMSRDIHPLCETRGPPGTHDLPLLRDTIERLLGAEPDSVTQIPKFDKRSDERAPVSEWTTFQGRPDAILIEGWMMGVDPDPAAPGQAPLNQLEATEDPDGVWRAWQERALQTDYCALWDRADGFLHLDAPSFDVVLKWRIQQEETTFGLAAGTLPQARATWVARFIEHFERLTRRLLDGGRREGKIVRVDADRRVLHTCGS